MSVDTRTITDAARRSAATAARVAARRRPAFRSALSVSRQPFLYLTAALATGILLDRWLEAPRGLIAPLALAAMAGAAGAVLVKKTTQATPALFIGLILAGAWLSLQERQGDEATRLRRLFAAGIIRAEDPVELIGVLARPPEPAPDAFFLD